MQQSVLSKKDKIIQRILEITPGALTWIVLLSPLTFGYFAPEVVIFLLSFFTFYWFYTVFMGLIHVFIGYSRYKKEITVDWYAKVKELNFSKLKVKSALPKKLEDLRHFLLVPIYSEPFEVLEENFKSIVNCNFDNSKFVLVYGIEERYADRVKADLKKIQNLHDKKGEIKIMTYIHPQGIPGEVMGVAGPNRDWAARHAVEELKNAGEDLNNYIFTTFDSDTQIHKEFFARLTYAYLTTPERKNRFFETCIHVFDNNTWRVPVLNRVSSDSITIALMASWSVPGSPFNAQEMNTFSCYSVALTTLIKADFWDPAIGIDDSIFFVRALKALQGDFEGVPYYIPIYLDVAEGKDYIDSHKSLYKQQLRWGWGIVDFPILIKMYPSLKKADIFSKVAHLWVKLELFVILRTIGFMLAFGLLFLSLVNPEFGQMNYAYSIPKINSVLLGITFGGFIPIFFIKQKLKRQPHPTWGLWQKILYFPLEYVMLYVSLLTFGFFPWIEAQTKMMFGKRYKSLYATPKFR